MNQHKVFVLFLIWVITTIAVARISFEVGKSSKLVTPLPQKSKIEQIKDQYKSAEASCGKDNVWEGGTDEDPVFTCQDWSKTAIHEY